jgi:colanic acid/amylovoran biosynthesis glycosyltransferase
MRILHSVDNFLMTSENWIYPQVVGVPGVESCVLCSRRENIAAFPIRRRDVIRAPEWPLSAEALRKRNTPWLSLGTRHAGDRIRRWQPSIVHAHFGMRAWQSLAIADMLNVPLVTSFYGFDAWRLPEDDPGWLTRYAELFDKGSLFLVEGPAMRDRLIHLGCPAEKIRIHRLGVDLRELTYRRKDFSGRIAVAMIGRFVEKKGLGDGLRACAEACARGLDVQVTVVGEAENDSAEGNAVRAELNSISDDPRLNGRVRFTGLLPLRHTRALLAEHDVYICPSKRAANGDAEGGSPVALTEAMAMGLYCVGTRHCDIPQLIIDGETGALCAERDVPSMANALSAIGSRPTESLDVTARARRHIERFFSLQSQLEGLKELYAALTADLKVCTTS